MLSDYFQLGPIPADVMHGTYDWSRVLLSYLVATYASYVALSMAGRLRDTNNTRALELCWLLGGAFAMGAGIWSMHFIGMRAFQLPMPMTFDMFWTLFSMAVAIFGSFIALSPLMANPLNWRHIFIGGVFLGIAIAAMHYTGMYAMTGTMIIHYMPGLFVLSIVIAIIAAEFALWMAIKSNHGLLPRRIRLKVISAIIMGAAICGMHYTGMAAAVFSHKPDALHTINAFSTDMITVINAAITFLILSIAFALSTHKEYANQHAISLARITGMEEVSSSILHSVGNVLNSLNVSAHLVEERIEQTKISELSALSELIQENQSNLPQFFTQDPRALKIPNYLKALAEHWQTEKNLLLTETKMLLTNVQHIKDIISAQQSLGNLSTPEQVVDMQSIIDEAITITVVSLNTRPIKINKEFDTLKPFLLDKIKFLQILMNLLHNAKDALIASTNEEKTILIKLNRLHGNTIVLQIIDNGIGIEPQNLKRIFTHGFSTKQSGHGYGLHSSAILAKQMGGSLTVNSLGKEQGATFTLTLPFKRVKNML